MQLGFGSRVSLQASVPSVRTVTMLWASWVDALMAVFPSRTMIVRVNVVDPQRGKIAKLFAGFAVGAFLRAFVLMEGTSGNTPSTTMLDPVGTTAQQDVATVMNEHPSGTRSAPVAMALGTVDVAVGGGSDARAQSSRLDVVAVAAEFVVGEVFALGFEEVIWIVASALGGLRGGVHVLPGDASQPDRGALVQGDFLLSVVVVAVDLAC